MGRSFLLRIFQRYAATLSSMPTVRGPHDGFTLQKKVATSHFINTLGGRTSDENQKKCRLRRRDISDMKNAGALYTVPYRDTNFNQYYKKFTRSKHSSQHLKDTILS